MAKIPEYLNVGSPENLTIPELLRIIEKMYLDIAVNLNRKPDFYQRPTDGLTTDTDLNIGDINLNTVTLNIQELVARPTASTVTWKNI